ncbi:MAG: hypothetical protein PHN39_04215 [Candidatus Pacebacteria bacterium]|nr:hypothetical protein [Candidatus Paceibacterota bacterium]
MGANSSSFILDRDRGNVKHTLHEVLEYIPREGWSDTIRFFKIIRRSGIKDFAAWAALYRWLKGRGQYAGIHAGLERYFKDEINKLLKIGA